MALLGLPERERNLEYECIGLLPDLEEAVLYTDTTIYDMESNFTFGIDEWWAEFIEDMSL